MVLIYSPDVVGRKIRIPYYNNKEAELIGGEAEIIIVKEKKPLKNQIVA